MVVECQRQACITYSEAITRMWIFPKIMVDSRHQLNDQAR